MKFSVPFVVIDCEKQKITIPKTQNKKVEGHWFVDVYYRFSFHVGGQVNSPKTQTFQIFNRGNNLKIFNDKNFKGEKHKKRKAFIVAVIVLFLLNTSISFACTRINLKANDGGIDNIYRIKIF